MRTRLAILTLLLAGCGSATQAVHSSHRHGKLCLHHYSIVTYSNAGNIVETPHIEWLPCASMGVTR